MLKNHISKAGNRLVSHGIESGSSAGQKLKAKQFAKIPETRDLEEARAFRPTKVLITEDHAKVAITKAATGKAAGPSGLQMEHLKSIAKHERGLTAITVFMELIANGSFGVLTSEGLRQSLIANARLIPLKRDAPGEKIRPIAVGESMRRLVCSAVVRARKAAIEEQGLKAHNLAFSKDGCNVGHKSIDLLLHEELPEDQRGPGALCMLPLLVGTDLEDAYQKASREIVLEKLFASEDRNRGTQI